MENIDTITLNVILYICKTKNRNQIPFLEDFVNIKGFTILTIHVENNVIKAKMGSRTKSRKLGNLKGLVILTQRKISSLEPPKDLPPTSGLPVWY